MTLVEFYDEKALENIAGLLYIKPQKVIFLGSRAYKLKRFAAYCREVLEDLGMETKIEYRTINPNSLTSMIHVLSEILQENDECEFNLTGGEESVMVAVGIVYERFKGHVQLHKINLNTGGYVDMDDDDNQSWDGKIPYLSVRHLIRIYGGSIINGADPEYTWNKSFCKAVRNLWELCRARCSEWNGLIGQMELAQKYGEQEDDELKVCLHLSEDEAVNTAFTEHPMFQKFCRYGYIRNFQKTASICSYRFRDRQIRQCLTRAGELLELAVYMGAMTAEDENGPVFQDGATGVYLNWDRITRRHNEQINTVNEIDVIMMHHMVPFFVSCKNGAVSVDELYKLKVVAEHFGLGYARKILVLTDCARKNPQTYSFIRERALDFNITIINDVHQMSIQEIGRELKKLCL